MDDHDLTPLLQSWKYEAGRINARQIEGIDGRPKLQLRLDLGVLQMELSGRPDGQRPQGRDSLLALHQERLREYTAGSGSLSGFVLSEAECRSLREEAVQYYHRYVALFALRDYAAVQRDTSSSLELFDLCHDYAGNELDQSILEQFRPQVITMDARAEAELAITAGQTKQALAALDRGLGELQRLYEAAGNPQAFDHANEVQLLRGMRDALVPKLPASQRAELHERLQAALDAENYELAAILRDELRMME